MIFKKTLVKSQRQDLAPKENLIRIQIRRHISRLFIVCDFLEFKVFITLNRMNISYLASEATSFNLTLLHHNPDLSVSLAGIT